MVFPAIKSPELARLVAGFYRAWLFTVGEDELNEVFPNVFVGSIAAAADADGLVALGITHIVAATQFGDASKFHAGDDRFEYLVVDVDDLPEQPIHRHFVQAGNFVQGAIDGGGRVLVHCNAGRSRSVSLVIAWLLRHQRYADVDAALAMIRSNRPQANPNPDFLRQLRAFAATPVDDAGGGGVDGGGEAAGGDPGI